MPSVLLVEDHVELAAMLAQFLGQHGNLDVQAVVHSGEDALEMLRTVTVDLVLVDISLPGMSGIDLIATLAEEHPHLPCLVLSGHREPAYVRRALAAGAHGYVAKGNPPALLEAVTTILDGKTYLSNGVQS